MPLSIVSVKRNLPVAMKKDQDYLSNPGLFDVTSNF